MVNYNFQIVEIQSNPEENTIPKNRQFAIKPNDFEAFNDFEATDPDGKKWADKYISHYLGAWIDSLIFNVKNGIISRTPPVVVWMKDSDKGKVDINHKQYYLTWKEVALKKGLSGKIMVVHDDGQKAFVSDIKSTALKRVKELNLGSNYFLARIAFEYMTILFNS